MVSPTAAEVNFTWGETSLFDLARQTVPVYWVTLGSVLPDILSGTSATPRSTVTCGGAHVPGGDFTIRAFVIFLDSTDVLALRLT